MIINLLEGIDNVAEEHFSKALIKNKTENIAWYPSSGNDFRLLSETSRTSTEPNLFVYTDYNINLVKLTKGEIFNDGKSYVTVSDIHELKFKRKIKFSVSSDFVDFPDDAPEEPKIFFLDVTVESSLGIVKKPVIYFFMENINFLIEVLLKYKIEISHFVKVREGCGFGGNKKSISLVYPFLGILRAKHILVDDSVRIDNELVCSISKQLQINPVRYVLKNTSKRNIYDWSGLRVKVFDVIIQNELMSEMDLNEIVKNIVSY
jgi:hypothetical protein